MKTSARTSPPFLEAAFAGYATGWNTPPFIPKMIRKRGFDPDLYVCDRKQRLDVLTLDNDRRWRPDVQGDMYALPFKDQSFQCVFFDPPYDVPYKRAINECGRVSRDAVIVLHTRDVMPPVGFGFLGRVLIVCGLDGQSRVLKFFRRKPEPEDNGGSSQGPRALRRIEDS